MHRRVLVTGGAGFVGSALVRRLVADGDSVMVLDNFSRGRQLRLPEGAVTVMGDIRDAALVSECVEWCEVVCHLAYVQGTQVFTEDPRLTIDVALTGMMNLLHACESHGGRELLLVSSSETYATPPHDYFPTDESVPLQVPDVTNPRAAYGGGKIACEIAALAYASLNERTVIVRIHNAYGPDMGFEHVIPQMAMRMLGLTDTAFPIQGTGLESRCFMHVDDCIDGLMILLDRGEHRGVYHLGTPWEITMHDLATLIAEHYARAIEIQPGELPKGSPPRRQPSIEKMRALGFEPKITLQAGLPETLDWYRVAWWSHALDQVAA